MKSSEYADKEAYDRTRRKELAQIQEKAFQLGDELRAFQNNVTLDVQIPVGEALIHVYRLYKSLAEIQEEMERTMK